MASTTAQLDSPRGCGPYCFRVHDQIYHRIGALHPLAGNPPQCAQVLIKDTEEEAAELAGRDVNRECDRATFPVFHQLLQTVQAYQLIDGVAREEQQRAVDAQRTQRPVRIDFCQLNSDGHGRYNIATVNEVAVVYVGNDEEIPGERYVVVYERGQGLRTISYLGRLCDPLSYPPLFPRGEDGWHPDMEKTTNKSRVKGFYSYLLFARIGTFNPLLRLGKLLQQYVVDSWLKIEMNSLNFLRKNQRGSVRGLQDYMIGDDTHDGPQERRIILAVSFTGCPRHMIGQYQDAMSIVSKHGKPDIFLTFTCNPNWREIQNNLAGGLSASDRPDLVTRVSSVELPDPDSDPKPFDIVSENMVHRPCGNLNPTSPCMRDGVCTKRFPRTFAVRRLLMWMVILSTEGVMTDYPIAPTCIFEAHINVKICVLIHVVKYLFKYVYKGPDRARIHIYQPYNDAAQTDRDEIEAYIDARYVCAPEAVHRIFGFKMQCRSEQRLQVHLPGS
ncbi:unnamed protein product [Heligmosomoides polygyrus]|uniref:Helitron_like_N domain-containing protein n=1 Tax=Heligmosomoides polygyrus TaxID=6339 RepID=A0A183F4A1_HELPZ|nr:unnamed protein product [Heligmosomoides polygyrus]